MVLLNWLLIFISLTLTGSQISPDISDSSENGDCTTDEAIQDDSTTDEDIQDEDLNSFWSEVSIHSVSIYL